MESNPVAENLEEASTETSSHILTAEAALIAIDNAQPLKSCSEIASMLSGIIPDLQRAGHSDRVAELELDRLACFLVIKPSITGSRPEKLSKAQRITGFATRSDGSVLPSVDNFGNEAYEYFSRRASSVTSPVLRSRYNDLIFSKSGLPNEHLYGLAAIDEYLESASRFAASAKGFHRIEMVNSLDQAVFLSTSMSNEDKVRSSTERVYTLFQDKAHEEANSLNVDENDNHPIGRWAIELAKLLLHVKENNRFSGMVTDEKMQDVQKTLMRLADENGRRQLHHLQRMFLSIAFEINARITNSIDWYKIQLEIGRSLEIQATDRLEEPRKSYLAAAAFYERAVEHYDRFRSDARLTQEQRAEITKLQDEAKKKIRPLYHQGRSEMGVISVPVDISQDEVEEMLDSILQGTSLKDKLRSIASEGSLLPNLKLARQLANEQGGLLAFLPIRSLRNDMTTHITTTELERYEAAVTSNVVQWIKINSAIILNGLFDRLRGDGLNTETILEFFDDWGMMDEDNIEIIRTGFDRYFANDYVSSLHILVPQFEDVFRTLLEKGGKVVINSRRGGTGFEYNTFGSFLNSSTVKDAMPEEIREYIKLVMTEQLGWNLRNDIAHGLLGPDGFTKYVADTVIHLFLILTLFKVSVVEY